MSHDQAHAKGPDVAPQPVVDVDRQRLESAWHAIEEYAASGRGSQQELPRYIAELGVLTERVIAKMPEIAKHANGATVLECAGVLKMDMAKSVELALHAAPPASALQLRDYLRRQDPLALAKLDGHPDVIADIRNQLKGPLGIELPDLARLPDAIATKPNLVRWFLDTTSPSLIAAALAGTSNDGLVATLDALAATTPNAWGWLEHVHIAAHWTFGPGLTAMRDKTTNAAARTKLAQLVAHYTDDQSRRDKEQVMSEPAFKSGTAGKDDGAFLEAAARTQGSQLVSREDVGARLRGESADMVLEYILTLVLDAAGVVDAVALLAASKAPTRAHVTRVFASTDSGALTTALSRDVTRRSVRQIVGRDATLHDLFSTMDLEYLHPYLIRDEALRQWAYEDGSPRNLLWLAVGSAEGAKAGCRLVQNERGNDWLKKVPRDVPEAQVRRFVLASTDAIAVAWARSNLLHDHAHKIDLAENNPHATSSYVYGQGAEIRPAIVASTGDSELVSDRLADLSPAERTHLLRDKKALATIFAAERGNELRAVELLLPTLVELTTFPIHGVRALVDYSVTRPANEQLAAAQQASAAQQVFGEVSPLMCFPALKQPAVLAKALDDNSELLAWILQETDASQALTLLSREPARQVVAQLIEADGKALEGLPAYELLRKAGRAGFDAIAKDLHKGDAKQAAQDYQERGAGANPEVDDRAKHVSDAVSYGNLVANIHKIIEAGGTRADAIAVVQAATPAQQLEFLSGHPEAVRELRNFVHLGPQHLFPDLGLAQLLAMPSTAEWLVSPVAGGRHAPTTVLHLLAQDRNAAAALATNFKENFPLAQQFVAALPKGAALTATERFAIDEIAAHVKYDFLLRMLFAVRFDVPIGDTYDEAETRRVWSILKRLPPAQVNQNAIQHLTEKPLGGPSGQWASPDIELEIDPAERDKNDPHYERAVGMTADEVKKAYGLDDKGLALAADPKMGWLIAADGKYVVKPIPDAKSFDNTVIHEVGHSVDTILGEHTELIFSSGYAGWSEFGYDQFEQWASPMGAFDSMTGPDRAKVVEVWQHALRSNTPVSKLVGPDHPAIANQQSPLAKFVDTPAPFKHYNTSLEPVNGHVFLQTPKALATVTKRAWDAAPTDYSMTAPAEYFAECYVEYYRDYDGTPATEAKKGGRLPGWIKQWFALHVDKIRFSPDRVTAGLGKP